MKFPKYYLSAATAFIIWGFFSFGLKPLQSYPSADILFYRVFVCTLLMVIINVAFRRNKITETKTLFRALPKKERQNQWTLIAGSSLLLTANWGLFIFVMNHISVKAASFAYMVCPILTTFFAFFLLKEKLSKIQVTAVAISLTSCTILAYNDLRSALFSVIVAATYALYLVIQKRIIMPDRFLLLTLQIGITALLLLPFFPIYGGSVPTEAKFYAYILLIAGVFTIIPMFLNLYAMKGISSSALGILIYINPLIGFMIALFYFRENISFLQVLAYSLVAASIVIFNIGSYRKTKMMQMNDSDILSKSINKT